MSETDLKRAVMKLFAFSGWLVTRAQAGRIRRGVQLARTGTADLVCCANGRYCEVELKLPGEELRESQKKRASEVIDRGGRYFVVRSLEDAQWCVKQMSLNGKEGA